MALSDPQKNLLALAVVGLLLVFSYIIFQFIGLENRAVVLVGAFVLVAMILMLVFNKR